MNPSTGIAPIALDAMGGDLGPSEVVAAVALAINELPEQAAFVLVGRESELEPLLEEQGLKSNPRVTVVHAEEVVAMDDKPAQALRRKRDASMFRAIEWVREGKAGAAISTGNTGALMAAGTLRLRPMPGIDRPALASIIPSQDHRFVLLDVGAYPESKAENLVHSAILGSSYAKVAIGISRPRVALLTIGTEEGKGTERIMQAHQYLSQMGDIVDYCGLIEGFQLFDASQDVVVCDGFTGNILLKSLESVFHLLKGFLKTELKRNPVRMTGALLAGGAFKAMKQELSPERYAGAPLLGLNHLVMKAHGSSDRHYIKGAITIGWHALQHKMEDRMQQDIEQANTIMHYRTGNPKQSSSNDAPMPS